MTYQQVGKDEDENVECTTNRLQVAIVPLILNGNNKSRNWVNAGGKRRYPEAAAANLIDDLAREDLGRNEKGHGCKNGVRRGAQWGQHRKE